MDVGTAGVSSLSMLPPPDTLEEGVSIYQHEDFRCSRCVTNSGNAAALVISSSHTPRVRRLSPLPASLPPRSPGLRWSLVSDSRTPNILTRPTDKLPIAKLFKTLWLWVQSSRLPPPVLCSPHRQFLLAALCYSYLGHGLLATTFCDWSTA